MQFGFVKVCAATVPIKVADVKFNTKNIISAIEKSISEGTQLIVFPELCLSGYTCGDLFNQSALIEEVDSALGKISEYTKGSKILVIVGAPIASCGKLYNCAVAIWDGKILGAVPKTHIPNYGEFYERRYFASAPKENSTVAIAGQNVIFGTNIIFQAKNMPAFSVACEICEDLWAPWSPSQFHAQAGANIISNLSCSDETVGKAEYRRDLVKIQSGKLVCAYIYSDSGDGESTTDMVYAGHNIIAENGSVLCENELFKNSMLYADIDVDAVEIERRRMSGSYTSNNSGYSVVEFTTSDAEGKIERIFPRLPFVPNEDSELSERSERILSIQSKGLEKRLVHTKAKTAVIGISGGLDSALALLVTARAFKSLGKNPDGIIAVTMPGFGTTDKTKNNSIKLIREIGASEKTISVSKSVLQHFKDIGHDPEDYDVTYENSQARMRTLILMDLANKTGGLVIGTGDLSELALGWTTYNGDHMSMYAVNSSVPKTLVKHLVNYEAERLGGAAGKVLKDILNTEISPELLPPDRQGRITQKTEDLVGPYILHDFFLYYAIRRGFSPAKVNFIAKLAFKGEFDNEVILKWLKNFYIRFFAQQFKRSCIPDGVKVGSVTLSPRGDWRMPSDAVASLWLEQLEKL